MKRIIVHILQFLCLVIPWAITVLFIDDPRAESIFACFAIFLNTIVFFGILENERKRYEVDE